MAFRKYLPAILLLMAGCQAPWIQWPSLYPRSPAAERASFTQHDPLPDSSIGPSGGGDRPREAATQRGEPRRTLEAAVPTMIQSGGPGGMQAPGGEYPATVVP